jgi:hypothetical protein
VNAKELISEVAKEYGLTVHELLAKQRSPLLDEARALAAFEVRMNTDLSWAKLGAVFGRNHMAVRSAVRTTMRRLRERPDMAETVRRLEGDLRLRASVDEVLAMDDDDVASREELVRHEDYSATPVFQRGDS